MATGTDVDPIKSLATLHWLAKNTSPILLELIMGCDLVCVIVWAGLSLFRTFSNIFEHFQTFLWSCVCDCVILWGLSLFRIFSNIFPALLWAWVDDTKIFIILVIFAILQKLWYKINIVLQRIVQECPFQERTLDKEGRVYQRSKKRKEKNQEKVLENTRVLQTKIWDLLCKQGSE